MDLAAGDAGGFGEDVAGCVIGLTREVVDHFPLGDVGGEALDVGPAAVEGDEAGDGLVDFRAVEDTAAAEDDTDAKGHDTSL